MCYQIDVEKNKLNHDIYIKVHNSGICEYNKYSLVEVIKWDQWLLLT